MFSIKYSLGKYSLPKKRVSRTHGEKENFDRSDAQGFYLIVKNPKVKAQVLLLHICKEGKYPTNLIVHKA